jgi:glyoxylase-like metal-dependent hydrolase (beta-lactamase superfamily II)
MKPVEVSEGVYSVTVPTPFAVGPVNIYIIIKENKSMMVDAGPNTEEAWHELQEAFAELDLNPDNLDAIVLTHHHPDHTGLIHHFKKDIPIYGHWRLGPWLTQDPNFAEKYKRFFRDLSIKMGVPREHLGKAPSIDRYLKFGGKGTLHTSLDEGDSVPGFEEWTVVYTPGHAYSHIGLLRNDGLFIAGDVLLENISSNAIIEPPYNDSESAPYTLLQYRKSLEKCLSLTITKVLPGHGQAFDYDDIFVTDKLQSQEERRNEIYKLIKEGKSTTLEIGMTMFKGVWKHQLDLVLSEVQGHLDWLITDGIVTIKEQNGVWIYHAK